jgi:hypothetical protein
MAQIQRFIEFEAGVTGVGRQTLGSFDERDPRYALRHVRVVPLNAGTVQLFGALVMPGDITVGPIDLPFDFNCELPVHVQVSCPIADTVNQTVMLIAGDLPNPPNLLGATHLEMATPGSPIPIPEMCVAVTLLVSGGTLGYFDGAMVPIGDADGNQPIARPRAAKFVEVSEPGGAVLFHY